MMNDSNAVKILQVTDLKKMGIVASTADRSKVEQKARSVSVEVLPGLYSGTEAYARFLNTVHKGINEASAVSSNPRFHSVTHLSPSDGRVLSLSGTTPSVHSFLNQDNRELRRSKGLQGNPKFGPRETEIFEHLVKMMFGSMENNGISVANRSSSGLPDVTFVKEEKIARFLEMLPRADELMRLVVDGQIFRCVNDFDVAPVYVQGYRHSPDKFGKYRAVFSLEGCTAGLAEGDIIPNYDAVINGKVLRNVQAMRARLVFGLHVMLNLLIAIWRKSVSNVYLKKYSATWHATGAHPSPTSSENTAQLRFLVFLSPAHLPPEDPRLII